MLLLQFVTVNTLKLLHDINNGNAKDIYKYL
jgi:hypothetical protein